MPCSGTDVLVTRTRQRHLRRWFDLGTATAFFMAIYACVLLAKEATLLLGRMGLTKAQVGPALLKQRNRPHGISLPHESPCIRVTVIAHNMPSFPWCNSWYLLLMA